MTTLRIGTRGSALARWQADRVKQLLLGCGVTSVVVPIETAGDRPGATPGTAVKGLFTREIEGALLKDRIDLAVHSLKDLWIELPQGLVLAAVPEREDPRDALVTRAGADLDDLPQGARVGTSSARRRAALLAYRPDLEPVPLRGNVPTRVARVQDGALDAAILALAGLKRLGLVERAVPLDPTVFVPAPGQGALAVEARATDDATRAVLAELDDPEVRAAVEAERAVLGRLETGCDVPIGALCRSVHDELLLQVAVYGVRGETVLRITMPVDRENPCASGVAAAGELHDAGAASVIAAAHATARGKEQA